MKTLAAILLTTYIICSCNSKKELSREEASRIIKENMKYPMVIDYDIYCSDPESAKKTIDAGLEKEGLVMYKLHKS